MAGIFQPQIVFQISEKLDGQIAHLGKEMSAPFAPEQEILRPGRIEEYHRLGGHGTVLGRPEREHIDPGLPCRLRRAAAQMDEGIGETGPVHMQAHAVFAPQTGEGRYLLGVVYRAPFTGLGNADDGRLGLVLVAETQIGDRFPDGLGRDPPGGAVQNLQRAAAGKQDGCTAFIFDNMGVAVTIDPAPGRHQGR